MYFAPYIDSTGYHMPQYSDIINSLITSAQTIFGPSIYLGADSQDYQFMSSVASIIYDSFLTAQLVYNNYGPGTAIGSALDSIVKLNGIKRMVATNSTYNINLLGIAGTVINNGVILDSNGIRWDLPTTVTLGSGTTTSIITCEQTGPISLGSTISIATPTYGWTSITAGTIIQNGTNMEVDSALRGRQGLSVAISSITPLDALKASLAAVSNMTRFKVYENYTSSVDSNGLPANSVTCVVEGGSDTDIANSIYLKRSLGCKPNGTTVIGISDSYGQTTNIGFYRPTYIDVDVIVNVKKLSGYTTQTTTNIQNAIVNFLNGFSIGTSLNNSGLWAAAMTANVSLNNPTFSITSLTDAVHGGSQATTDLTLLFNQVLRGNLAYITVNAS